ncbi:hypothetical protein MAPG_02349 [Magnaporthiopsis poae ATCC 64411]|uniref:F-box domain-containing protein n=1 Tax=Magnaporthiopsis poae (strain ATCC 64411 / 73-15) TaxID=644358 RepID=A0A0C4DR47_MAGP6|nr:hypothetical protein MAPG_02349 [Magnaporthiopsis poae ATCC 64411]
MACDFLSSSGPPELILNILTICESTRDILALVRTCRRIHDVWREGATAVLWPRFLREKPEFEDALIAARLTNLVVEAETKDELPPVAVSPSLFGSRRRGPTLEELKAAAALRRVCRGLAVGLTFERALGFNFETDARASGPEDRARMRRFETRVIKAFLKLFICGAALAGAYNEPLFRARSSGDPELERLVDSPGDYRDLSGRQLEFLERSAVCNMQATAEAEEAVFGPLGDWLLSSILSDSEARAEMVKRFELGSDRASYCQQQSRWSPCRVKLVADESVSHPDAHLVVWEVMKMIWTYEYLGGLACPRPHVDAIVEIDQAPSEGRSCPSWGVQSRKADSDRARFWLAVRGLHEGFCFPARPRLFHSRRARPHERPSFLGSWCFGLFRLDLREIRATECHRGGRVPNCAYEIQIFRVFPTASVRASIRR